VVLVLATGGHSVREQIAILMQDHSEWIFITDDEEPERVFKSVGDAMKDLSQDGWEVCEGPGVVSSALDALGRNDSWGFKLRRGIQ
jgi:hypothetical protein